MQKIKPGLFFIIIYFIIFSIFLGAFLAIPDDASIPQILKKSTVIKQDLLGDILIKKCNNML